MSDPRIQTALGGLLFTNPWWADFLNDVAKGASWVAVVCGAIIGVHGVWKIIRGK